MSELIGRLAALAIAAQAASPLRDLDLPAALFALLVLLVVAVAVWFGFGGGADLAGRNTELAIEALERRARRDDTETADERDRALRLLAQREPSFDLETFLQHAERAFLEVQHARANGDFAYVHRIAADGLMRRWTVEAATRRFHGRRLVIGDPRVHGRRLVGASCDDEFDVLQVELDWTLRACEVSARRPLPDALAQVATAPIVSGREVWEFSRRLVHGGDSGSSPVAGRCPGCGVPAVKLHTPNCSFCGAILNSGAYDWVLIRVSSLEEHRAARSDAVPGLARLKAEDPAVHRSILEDRAALVFWGWIEALATGEPRPFARLCHPRAYVAMSPIQGRPAARYLHTELAALTLVGVDSDVELDRAHFLVHYQPGHPREAQPHSEILILGRERGFHCQASWGFSTDRCHHCSAPQEAQSGIECPRCGVPLNLDWSLVGIASPEAVRALSPRLELRPLEVLGLRWERRRLLAEAAVVLTEGARLAPRHRSTLTRWGRRWALTEMEIRQALASPPAAREDLQPKSLDEGRAFFRRLAEAGSLDGRLDRVDRALLDAIAPRLRLTPEEARAARQELSARTRPTPA